MPQCFAGITVVLKPVQMERDDLVAGAVFTAEVAGISASDAPWCAKKFTISEPNIRTAGLYGQAASSTEK